MRSSKFVLFFAVIVFILISCGGDNTVRMVEKTYPDGKDNVVVYYSDDKDHKKIKEWRDSNYEGASNTSKALLEWWFKKQRPEFQYYFAQREAVETIIYLFEVIKIKDKYDLIRYDATGRVSPAMFDETWKRFIIKMATGWLSFCFCLIIVINLPNVSFYDKIMLIFTNQKFEI